jgi:hypothetical protein
MLHPIVINSSGDIEHANAAIGRRLHEKVKSEINAALQGFVGQDNTEKRRDAVIKEAKKIFRKMR